MDKGSRIQSLSGWTGLKDMQLLAHPNELFMGIITERGLLTLVYWMYVIAEANQLYSCMVYYSETRHMGQIPMVDIILPTSKRRVFSEHPEGLEENKDIGFIGAACI